MLNLYRMLSNKYTIGNTSIAWTFGVSSSHELVIRKQSFSVAKRAS